jgi:hypothetical protein
MLSLTPQSEARALRLLSELKGRKVSKVSGKGLDDLRRHDPEGFARLYVVNRSMFGAVQGLGPDDEGALSSLTGLVTLRVNGDRDVVQLVLR